MAAFVYHENYYCDIGEHVFPMEKFQMVRDRLIKESGLTDEDFIIPEPATEEMLLNVHDEKYLDDLFCLRKTPAILRSELPVSEQIVNAYILAAGGTFSACREACEQGCAVNLTGGFHHAFTDRAEGFCYINDIAVGIRALQNEYSVKRFLVVDCDLHQGNGTAVIFQQDPDVFTFSIHQERLYPKKEKSDLDIGLEMGTGDDIYLGLLEENLKKALYEHNPQFIIYVAGADPFKKDLLGSLLLTREGLSERDRILFNTAQELNVPIAVVLAGGYSEKLEDTVDIHVRMCVNAIEAFGPPG